MGDLTADDSSNAPHKGHDSVSSRLMLFVYDQLSDHGLDDS
jgi:hypothetical protein